LKGLRGDTDKESCPSYLGEEDGKLISLDYVETGNGK
jgi:hypothetical protein